MWRLSTSAAWVDKVQRSSVTAQSRSVRYPLRGTQSTKRWRSLGFLCHRGASTRLRRSASTDIDATETAANKARLLRAMSRLFSWPGPTIAGLPARMSESRRELTFNGYAWLSRRQPRRLRAEHRPPQAHRPLVRVRRAPASGGVVGRPAWSDPAS